jgi:chromate transporter
MRNSKPFVFLDAVNVASIAIIVSICYELGKETITDWRTILIAILSVDCFKYKKVNSALVVVGGAFWLFIDVILINYSLDVIAIISTMLI